MMASVTVWAAPPSRNVQDAAPLTLEAEKAITLHGSAAATWNFGRRKPDADGTITHTFTLHNAGRSPLVLDSLTTSCHCTTAALVGPGVPQNGDTPFTLLPGKSVGLRVTIEVEQAHAADFRKLVWISIQGRDEPVLTLTVVGMISGA